MPVRLVDLPPELLALVCRGLDQASLVQLALSCAALRDTAVRQLWTEPRVYGRAAGEAFHRTAKERPELADAVVILRCDDGRGALPGILGGQTCTETSPVFRRCTDLSLHGPDVIFLLHGLRQQPTVFPKLARLTAKSASEDAGGGAAHGLAAFRGPTFGTLKLIDYCLLSRYTPGLFDSVSDNLRELVFHTAVIYREEVDALAVLGRRLRLLTLYVHPDLDPNADADEESFYSYVFGLANSLPLLESLDIAPGPLLGNGIAPEPFNHLMALAVRLSPEVRAIEPNDSHEPAGEAALRSLLAAFERHSPTFPALKTFRLSMPSGWLEDPSDALVALRARLEGTAVNLVEDTDTDPWERLG